MFSKTCGFGPVREITRWCVLSFKSQPIGSNRQTHSKFDVQTSCLLFFWNSFTTTTGSLTTRFDIGSDLNICEPEEGRFNVWNQTFIDGDAWLIAMSHLLFHDIENVQPDSTRRDSWKIDRISICLPTVGTRDFVVIPMFLRMWEPVNSEWSRGGTCLVNQEPWKQGRCLSWMSKHPVFCSMLLQVHNDHRFSDDPFLCICWVLHNRVKMMTIREHMRKTFDSIGRSSLSFLLFCVPLVIDILGHSCDVVRNGNRLKIASMRRSVCWFPKTQPNHCESYSWSSCGTWGWGQIFSLDANRERHCF